MNVNDQTSIILRPIGSEAMLKSKLDMIEVLRETVMMKGVHYGPPYPGSDKDVLLKPGGELLASYFGLRPKFNGLTLIERFDPETPLFHYRYECELIDIFTGLVVGTGIGSCNSMELKYRWRWVAADKLPNSANPALLETRNGTAGEFKFAIDAGQTNGKYGKPAAYWQAFRDAIEKGTARKSQRDTKRGPSDYYEIGSIEYRLPNDDIFSLVGTFDKQSQKRAFMGAVLVTTGASYLFTQDVEDFKEHEYFGNPNLIEGDITVVPPSELTIVTVPSATSQPAPESVPAQPTPQQPPEAPKKSQPAAAKPDWTPVWAAFKALGFRLGNADDIQQVFGGKIDQMTPDEALKVLEAFKTADGSH